jgi:hypothetical protein
MWLCERGWHAVGLSVNDILASFGAFMAALIAIETFLNIVLYLRDNVLHVK